MMNIPMHRIVVRSNSLSIRYSKKSTSSLLSSCSINSHVCHKYDKYYHCQNQKVSFFHSNTQQKKNINLSGRDTRIKGLRRFYKNVGITPASPPWEESDTIPRHDSNCNNNDHQENDNTNDPSTVFVNNPISPGVDGSLSATGVSLDKASPESRRLSLTPSSSSSSSWYAITLDGRQLKTPLGNPLSVPSLPLSLALASEWDDQLQTIQPTQMPLMTLVCTALDQMTIPSIRIQTIDKLLSYLRNDTTCYWADPTEDRILYRHQVKYWKDVHDYMEKVEGIVPAKAIGAGEGLIMSRVRENGKQIAGLPHSEETIEKARDFLEQCDAWTLTAMQSCTMEAKSFLIGMALIRSSSSSRRKMMDVDQNKKNGPFYSATSKAVLASRVEEEFQIESWGLVEGGHDYDRLNCSVNMHAACFLVQSIHNQGM